MENKRDILRAWVRGDYNDKTNECIGFAIIVDRLNNVTYRKSSLIPNEKDIDMRLYGEISSIEESIKFAINKNSDLVIYCDNSKTYYEILYKFNNSSNLLKFLNYINESRKKINIEFLNSSYLSSEMSEIIRNTLDC